MNHRTQELEDRIASQRWLRIAFWLSMIALFYHAIVGVIATYFGLHDDTLALFGFGIYSLVEVLSGIGTAHRLYRRQSEPVKGPDPFEQQVDQLVGISFYLLAGGMVLTSGLTIWAGEQPQTTRVGVIIAAVSVMSIYFLVKYKIRVGKALNFQPIISDAQRTKTCLYLSVLLLVSSSLYELFRIPYVDVVGALGISWFALKGGREAFLKA